MTSPIHVKILNKEAIASKKELLYGQIDMLHLLKKLTNFRKYRKEELAFRDYLGSQMTALKSLFKKFESSIPEVDKREMTRIKQNVMQAHTKKTIESDLKKIHDKLARLEE